jgi:hypothetical protein
LRGGKVALHKKKAKKLSLVDADHQRHLEAHSYFEKETMKKKVEKFLPDLSVLPKRLFVKRDSDMYLRAVVAGWVYPDSVCTNEVTIGEYKLVRAFKAKAAVQITEKKS